MKTVNADDIAIVMRPCVTGLPTDAYVEYFGRLSDGRDFVIFRPRYDWHYEDFVCVIGGRYVEINRVARYRDGGTTIINTQLGEFFFPTVLYPEKVATFGGVPLTLHPNR